MPIAAKKPIQDLSLLSTFLKSEENNQRSLQIFNIENHIGEGQIRSTHLSDGLLVLHFDVLLKEDTWVSIDSDEMDVVHFLYTLKGNCLHTFNKETATSEIVEKQTAVVLSGTACSSWIRIKKDEPLSMHLIRMDKQWYQNNVGNQKKDTQAIISQFSYPSLQNMHSFHSGQFNFEIAELVQKLELSNYSNEVSERSYFKGLSHIILALQIKQFRTQISEGDQPTTTLLKRELQHIVELTEFVKNYPEVLHSVSSLCSKSGLSAAKLQEGFKFLHQQTVGEFIRNVRLKRSEFLLRTSEMNISEVVYSIGFTSRSYFCKIFKVKYGCSPKKYKSQLLQNLQLTA